MLAYWKRVNGWKSPGYHIDIHADGFVETLLPFEEIANGVAGFNSNSVHICTKGGIDAKGNPIDNRTAAQKKSLVEVIKHAKHLFPNAVVLGHRDFSTDKNGNGLIDQWEFIKSCPCYDVRDWLKDVGLEKTAKPSGIVYKLNFPIIKDSFVGEIQTKLKAAGYKVGFDEKFGTETQTALIAFQKKKGLKPTGIADDHTISLLGVR